MAVNVRVLGPELLVEENRRAFLRIEESIRQYSAHTRESIYLLRRPLAHTEDHFALVWTYGLALVEMVPIDGVVRGSKSGFWHVENPAEANSSHSLQVHMRREHRTEPFPNPYLTLIRMRSELSDLVLAESLMEETEGALHVAIIALFTAAPSLQVEQISDSLFSALTLPDALARSIMHRPNILRASETPGESYTKETLELISAVLEESAERLERNRISHAGPEPEMPQPIRTAPLREHHGHSPYWLVLILLLLVAFTYAMIRVVLIRSTPASKPSTPKVVSHTPSEIIIQTPVETELFISPFQFRSREQLDRALTYGEGMRFLPNTEQIVVMDSLSLAKGIYGYFKVEDAWRKGMLLQTLSHTDTIAIVKFLDPLP